MYGNRETIESTVLENLMINIRIAPPDRDITNENAMEILTMMVVLLQPI